MDYRITSLSQLSFILKGLRKKKHMSQTDLAKELNISQQAVAKLESNPESTSVERLYRVLRILDVNIAFTDGISSVQSKQSLADASNTNDETDLQSIQQNLTQPSSEQPTEVPVKKCEAKRLKVTSTKKNIQAPRPVVKIREQW